jgi:hypothetical protein
MFKPDVLAERASAIFFERAERRLEALLAEHGVSNPDELPRSLQWQLLQQACVEAAAANFQQTNLAMMRHQLSSFGHSAFLGAMDRMIVSSKFPRDAFEMATGIHAAVVLAGYGLPVAPFHLTAMRIFAKTEQRN